MQCYTVHTVLPLSVLVCQYFLCQYLSVSECNAIVYSASHAAKHMRGQATAETLIDAPACRTSKPHGATVCNNSTCASVIKTVYT